MEAFWKSGYAGTSLDDLAAATGMNRPSLYAAFGDKRALYFKALRSYWRMSAAEMRDVFAAERPLRESLTDFYDRALSIYYGGVKGRPRGCFSVSTATTEAAEDPEIRAALAESVRRLDSTLETAIRAARDRGEIGPDADPSALAVLGAGTLHTIAIRARAGAPRGDLEALARKAVKVICGAMGPAATSETGLTPVPSPASGDREP
ncbi:MAG TPA: TetR/AcrR family transcriptional regulator [Roseiarcus sp.]|nr:TetR/AcrR family transcriptional regulator [Roseiarcus sp.]